MTDACTRLTLPRRSVCPRFVRVLRLKRADTNRTGRCAKTQFKTAALAARSSLLYFLNLCFRLFVFLISPPLAEPTRPLQKNTKTQTAETNRRRACAINFTERGAPNKYWLHLSTQDTPRNTGGEKERKKSRENTCTHIAKSPRVTTAASPSSPNQTCREKQRCLRSVGHTYATNLQEGEGNVAAAAAAATAATAAAFIEATARSKPRAFSLFLSLSPTHNQLRFADLHNQTGPTTAL